MCDGGNCECCPIFQCRLNRTNPSRFCTSLRLKGFVWKVKQKIFSKG